MKNYGRSFWVLLFTASGLNAVLWGSVLWLFPKDNPTTILHYTTSSGIDFIGEGSKILTLPAAGLTLLVLNTLVGLWIYTGEQRISWLVWTVSPLVQLILCSAFFLLLYANTAP